MRAAARCRQRDVPGGRRRSRGRCSRSRPASSTRSRGRAARRRCRRSQSRRPRSWRTGAGRQRTGSRGPAWRRSRAPRPDFATRRGSWEPLSCWFGSLLVEPAGDQKPRRGLSPKRTMPQPCWVEAYGLDPQRPTPPRRRVGRVSVICRWRVSSGCHFSGVESASLYERPIRPIVR